MKASGLRFVLRVAGTVFTSHSALGASIKVCRSNSSWTRFSFIEGRDVVTYGASLGAYAAFYFGGAIGARIIGAAPMQSLWPEVMVKRWEGVPLIHNRLEDTPKPHAACGDL